jgi:tRNA dimethylallyltransferase
MPDLITILGPTATGKTKLATALAFQINGEIISADSRQVYKGLDIGTGKDLADYWIEGQQIPFHLIDIVDISYEYNLFDFQQDFLKAYNKIKSNNKMPILCGGTGLYLESVLKRYNLQKAPYNEILRDELSEKSDDVLIEILSSMRPLHNKTDTEERERLLRAIEITKFEQENPDIKFPALDSVIFGVKLDRQTIKFMITQRLQERLKNGMIEEVDLLLKKNVPPERLFKLGLEYKFVAQYLLKQLNYNDMYQKLNSAIHAFAKRQMTWFRKMEREGLTIHWINGTLNMQEKVSQIIRKL